MVQAKFGKQIECIMGYSKSDNTQFCSFSILEKRVLQTLLLAYKKRKKFNTRFVSHINTKVHPRRLRGGQLGQEKLAAKVFNTGQESPWDITLDELVPQLICCFHDLRLRRSSPANSIVSRTCLAHARQLSSRRVFGEMGPKKPKKFHNW